MTEVTGVLATIMNNENTMITAECPAGSGSSGTVYTVHIGNHRYVDVMYRETGLCYVMETENDDHIYDSENRTYGRLSPGYERAVVCCVQNRHRISA